MVISADLVSTIIVFRFQAGDDIPVEFFGFFAQQIGIYVQLGEDIHQCIDAAFYLEEFVEYNHFFGFKDAIAALKSPSFVTKHITCFIGDLFEFVKGGLCVLHQANLLVRVFSRGKIYTILFTVSKQKVKS